MPRQEVRDRVKAMMMKVGLLPNLINRYPHEFSGGQCTAKSWAIKINDSPISRCSCCSKFTTCA
jgi:ABC-type microcin C transport system duplicated ATPase subunit YejF